MYHSRHVFIENFNTFIENHRKNPEFSAVVIRSFAILISNITQVNRRELAQIKTISKRNALTIKCYYTTTYLDF